MKFHDELNPVIWDKDNNNEMRPEVKDKLNEIADAFIEFIEIPDDAILDMVITGSSASYNYNEHSDLDLHIIVDYDKIHEDCPLVEGYLGALKNTFNKEHDIFIHGVPVELYAEKKDQGTVHNGLYSLKDEKWIDIPRKIPPTTNDAAVEAKYQEIKDMVDKCDDSEAANELLEKIYKMRKAGLSEVGEFSTENLAFKKLRNEGCMDKLRQLKKEKIDKQLSLESYQESINEDDLTPTQKDYDRINKIFDDKNFKKGSATAKSITDPKKAYRRFQVCLEHLVFNQKDFEKDFNLLIYDTKNKRSLYSREKIVIRLLKGEYSADDIIYYINIPEDDYHSGYLCEMLQFLYINSKPYEQEAFEKLKSFLPDLSKYKQQYEEVFAQVEQEKAQKEEEERKKDEASLNYEKTIIDDLAKKYGFTKKDDFWYRGDCDSELPNYFKMFPTKSKFGDYYICFQIIYTVRDYSDDYSYLDRYDFTTRDIIDSYNYYYVYTQTTKSYSDVIETILRCIKRNELKPDKYCCETIQKSLIRKFKSYKDFEEEKKYISIKNGKNESIKEGIKKQVFNNRTRVNEQYINVSSGLYIRPCEPDLEKEFKEAVKQCKSLYEFERKFPELAQECEICAVINDHEYCSFDLEDLCDNIEYGFENSYVETTIDEWIVEEDKVYVGYLTLEAGDEDFDESLDRIVYEKEYISESIKKLNIQLDKLLGE